MAVTQTGAMYKSLTFDSKTSREFGVYITGEAVYNAPQRAVEMISIPGRNGSFALDQGRFENIEVSYPAGIFAENEADFVQAVSDFRNYLCSRKGYCRLTDEYNPSEYRMAVYKSGLEVDPAQLRAGEFKITFECKPQRWLTSGESAVSVTSGDTITNPTLFEAGPLLELTGIGLIEFNGYEIEINNPDYGELLLYDTGSLQPPFPTSITLANTENINVGDTITANYPRFYTTAMWAESTGIYITDFTLTSCTGPDGCRGQAGRSATIKEGVLYTLGYVCNYFPDPIYFTFGTPETKTVTCVGTATVRNQSNLTITATASITYDGNDTMTFSLTQAYSRSQPTILNTSYSGRKITAYSTKPYYTGNLFCDCDIGEIYRIEGGVPISMNHTADLGSKLPTLASGENVITYDNTFTELKITPRWWKV